jgi:glucosyl-3-phosphoglycerate synthase
MANRRAPYRILLPLANPRTARDLVRIGAGIRRRRTTQITALGIVEVPEGISLSEGAIQARGARRLLQRVLDFGDQEGVDIRTSVRIGRAAADGIIEAAGEEEADLLIFGWAGPSPAENAEASLDSPVFSRTIDAVVHESPCDIAVVKQRGLDEVRSILVPVRGGPHAALAMQMALDLGARFKAQVAVMHVIPANIGPEAAARAQVALDRFIADHAGRRRIAALLVEARSVRAAILAESRHHDLVIMGASARVPPRGSDRMLFGVVAETVAAQARTTVMVVKTGTTHDAALFDALRETEGSLPAADALVEVSPSPASAVDRWFAENTFHAREFTDLRKLVELKERQGLTISVWLPALNEEATIGRVISRIKGPLMERVPLIDQLVVIDSSSSDRTAEIARELGVPVVEHRTILPELGSFSGKGEALWKSLHVLDGDIVAWIDTDIRNIQPRFVYGLLGPLLAQPRIQYVKGFYQRPIRQSGTLVPQGGGRVTELMARPLINLFIPELSGLVQPLAGEYAGRRTLLESVTFFTGYAVEIGLLIDTLDAAGLSAIGQVDLERRIHRNQPLPDLSEMAFAILQATIRKVQDRQQLEAFLETGRGMNVIHQTIDTLGLEIHPIGDELRPPMRTVPAYLERRAQLKSRTSAK